MLQKRKTTTNIYVPLPLNTFDPIRNRPSALPVALTASLQAPADLTLYFGILMIDHRADS